MKISVAPKPYTLEGAAQVYIGRWLDGKTAPTGEAAGCCTAFHDTRGRALHRKGLLHVALLTGVKRYELAAAVARALAVRAALRPRNGRQERRGVALSEEA